MNLTIELSPEEEARLATLAEEEGVDPAAFVQQLVRQHLPSDTAEPPAPSQNAAAIALMDEWLAEDRAVSPEEREAANHEWGEFRRSLGTGWASRRVPQIEERTK